MANENRKPNASTSKGRTAGKNTRSARARTGKAPRSKALGRTGIFGAVAAVVLCAAVSLWGGNGIVPTWTELYQMAGVSNGSPAIDGDGNAASEPTKVHFIDVGQGDSVLIEQDGEYGMIDAGTPDCETALLSYLDQLGVKKLKVLVMTHPHADHIGSMAAVLRKYPVETFVLPQFDLASEFPTSATFEKVIAAAEDTNTPTVTAEIGQSYAIGSGTLTVVGVGVKSNSYNNISVSTLFSDGTFRFLDTGDCEKEAEASLLESGQDLSAAVFKAGHHGSSTSNTLKFLQAVRPQTVGISCGKDNDYGHPHKEALENFAAVGAEVYRTDELGSIVVGYAPDTGVKIYAANTQNAKGEQAA
jgi:beta-lactamase superfamily II metal-dependent hydrolase